MNCLLAFVMCVKLSLLLYTEHAQPTILCMASEDMAGFIKYNTFTL